MNMNTFTRNELNCAQSAKQFLKPAFDALQKINVQSVGNDADAYKKITSFNAWLGNFVLQADEVINRAQGQYDNRPKNIINAVSARLNRIPMDVVAEQKAIEHKIAAHDIKVRELQIKNFSSAEIEAITPYPQAELDTHASVIASLETELKSITAFLNDAPMYDVGLLCGVDIESALIYCNLG